MSDIHVDKLNNSQLVLLVLLISLVVSAATSVATLSVVYERLALTAESTTETQPTIVRQTINRIIEREPVVPAVESVVVDTQHTQDEKSTALTLEDIEQSLVQIYFGSQPFARGVYVSPEGHILAAEVLDSQRRYGVSDEKGNLSFFSILHSDKQYSLLAPVDKGTHSVQKYVPLKPIPNILLGEAVVLFSGSGENAQLHTGIVSQKKAAGNSTTSFRVSTNPSDITNLSVVFIEDMFAGFANPYADWVVLPSATITSKITQTEQGQTPVSEGVKNTTAQQ